ncbi:MAG TPA: DUF5667 domain-containing protein [Nocardioides sp.]|uniref:DUF5667 domain-containing protein n=1 Tax=Nocardioides sp. TaxID=35761 RepID=UPI002D80ACB4|nr:DUF5667 domain-containing protein [Nocardioides sp.]HET6653649.1 DUF5667 domain-containing protein [Nocardioides sp.]
MTALFSAQRRAEEFDAAVSAPHRAPHREVREELRPLVDLVGTLRSQAADDPQAVPRAEFAADLRSRLMAEAAEVMTPDSVLVLPTRPRGRRERRLVAAASAVVLLGGSAGMAAAAQNALPGDALYPVKRGIERVEAGVSISPAGKGRDLLRQANGRLSEVDALLSDDSVAATTRVPKAVQDFTAQAEQGSGLLLDAYQETRDPDTVRSVREFTAEGIGSLQDLAATAPPETQEELTDAALALRDIDRRAAALCSTCASDLPVVEVPGALLVATEADRALTSVDPARLDNSHPFLVPKSMLPKDGKAGGPRSGGTDGPGSVLGGATGGATDGLTDGLTGTDPGDGGGTSPGGSSPLPSPQDVTESGKKKLEDTTAGLRDTVDGTVGSITDGLSGVVATLLPDPQPSTGSGLLPGSGSGSLLP